MTAMLVSSPILYPSPETRVMDTGSGEDQHDACAICLDRMERRATTDACRHFFCAGCIIEWSKISETCPMCKRQISEIRYDFADDDDKSYKTLRLESFPFEVLRLAEKFPRYLISIRRKLSSCSLQIVSVEASINVLLLEVERTLSERALYDDDERTSRLLADLEVMTSALIDRKTRFDFVATSVREECQLVETISRTATDAIGNFSVLDPCSSNLSEIKEFICMNLRLAVDVTRVRDLLASESAVLRAACIEIRSIIRRVKDSNCDPVPGHPLNLSKYSELLD